VGASFFLFVFVLLHWLVPDVRIVADYISDYANAPYGRLFQSALALHGLGNLAIATGLLASLGSSRVGKIGGAFFAAASAGIIIAAIFPADPSGVSATFIGSVHVVTAFVAFVFEALALFFLIRVFQNAPSWRTMAAPTLIIAGIDTVTLVWLLASWQGASPGLAEHVAFIPVLLWETLVALRLLVLRPL